MAAATHLPVPKQSIGFKRILVATDFSEISRRAASYALAIARQYNSEMYFVHAIPAKPSEASMKAPLVREIDQARFDAQKQMNHFVEPLAFGDLVHHSLVERGTVADVICSIGERENINLLVLGTHGRGGLKKLALGSVAEEMLRLVPCPTLTVGQHTAPLASRVPAFRRILFATDFGTCAAKALPLAVALTQEYDSHLTLLHMMPPIRIPDPVSAAYGAAACLADELISLAAKEKEENIEKLRRLIPSQTKLSVEPEYVVGTDSPAGGILQVAAARRIDLIVMGANQVPSPRTTAHMLGTVAHHVICEATCPVLTVRG